MDLVIVNKQNPVHYILPIIIFFSTIILSYAKIQETALPFLLPLFIRVVRLCNVGSVFISTLQ